jgi:alpha-D-ribose 1-methylphosphonate 5-triphosphate synthase subunit PhnH
MTPEETRAHAAFVALMGALSYPGRRRALGVPPTDAFSAIADALIDLEVSYYSPDARLRAQLARTGARAAASQLARYHFYPTLTRADVAALRDASVGSHALPDDSATLIVGCDLSPRVDDESLVTRLRLSGPGIPGAVDLLVGGIPGSFWSVRAQVIRYPLGWDVFLVSEGEVVGLPRTATVGVW